MDIYLDIFSVYPANPYKPPFRPNEILSERLILFEFNYSFADSEYQFEFIDALKNTGENGFYVSLTETTPETSHQDLGAYHWNIPLDDAKDYGRELHYLENAAYSEDGKWGMIFSQDEHAILACTPELMRELEKRIPDIHEQVYKFFELMKSYRIDYKIFHDWLKPLLVHVYGEEKGNELYREYL